MEDDLEPELVRLVNDHEEHLVVRALGERVLQVEQLVDAQVGAVVGAGHTLTPPSGHEDVREREGLGRRQLIEVAVRGALSGRQRRNREACRKRPLWR